MYLDVDDVVVVGVVGAVDIIGVVVRPVVVLAYIVVIGAVIGAQCNQMVK